MLLLHMLVALTIVVLDTALVLSVYGAGGLMALVPLTLP